MTKAIILFSTVLLIISSSAFAAAKYGGEQGSTQMPYLIAAFGPNKLDLTSVKGLTAKDKKLLAKKGVIKNSRLEIPAGTSLYDFDRNSVVLQILNKRGFLNSHDVLLRAVEVHGVKFDKQSAAVKKK